MHGFIATITTVLEIAAARGRVVPEHVSWVYERRLTESRARLGLRTRRGPP